MSSSSSSESSAKAKKKKKEKDKGKKDKKCKKEKDKSKKDDKKNKKRSERAEAWECDKPEAVRLIKALVQIDSSLASELEGVFTSIDSGETVRLDGLENKQVKKKLRHLLQALRLSPADGQAFKSPDKKVSFTALFRICLKGAGLGTSAAVPDPDKRKEVQTTDQQGHTARAPGNADAVEAAPVSVDEQPDNIAAPAKRGPVGPQLPMPGIGPAGNSGVGDSDEEPDADGPRMEGQERQGVDLDALYDKLQRPEWMTVPCAELAGAFGEAPPRKGDRFAVKRTPEEQEAFEKAMKDRGDSLLQQRMDGKFSEHTKAGDEAVEQLRKQSRKAQEVWGLSEKDQQRAAAGTLPGSQSSGPSTGRRAFDPERDMRSVKPISRDDFAKLVENSGSDLMGRFSRSQVSTSFL